MLRTQHAQDQGISRYRAVSEVSTLAVRKDTHMRTEGEVSALFTEYFGDKITPAQMDILVADVVSGIQNRRGRVRAAAEVQEQVASAPPTA